MARSLQVPPVLLWIQPAAVLDIYYFYFNGYGEIIRKNITDPSYCIELPGLPLLNGCDLPSFTLPSNAYPFLLSSLQEQLDAVSQDINPKILVNTFDELEPEGLQTLDKLNLIGIGPLIPSVFLDEENPTDTSFGGDLFKGLAD